jgi:hypothetical protein
MYVSLGHWPLPFVVFLPLCLPFLSLCLPFIHPTGLRTFCHGGSFSSACWGWGCMPTPFLSIYPFHSSYVTPSHPLPITGGLPTPPPPYQYLYTTTYNKAASKLLYIKLPMYLILHGAYGFEAEKSITRGTCFVVANSGSKKVSISRAHPFQCPS